MSNEQACVMTRFTAPAGEKVWVSMGRDGRDQQPGRLILIDVVVKPAQQDMLLEQFPCTFFFFV